MAQQWTRAGCASWHMSAGHYGRSMPPHAFLLPAASKRRVCLPSRRLHYSLGNQTHLYALPPRASRFLQLQHSYHAYYHVLRYIRVTRPWGVRRQRRCRRRISDDRTFGTTPQCRLRRGGFRHRCPSGLREHTTGIAVLLLHHILSLAGRAHTLT